LLSRLSRHPDLSGDNRRVVVTTNLIVEESVPDIFHNSGHSQNVILTFFEALGVDTIMQDVSIIPNQPESARRESELSWSIAVGAGHPLKQPHASFVLALTPHCVFIVFIILF